MPSEVHVGISLHLNFTNNFPVEHVTFYGRGTEVPNVEGCPQSNGQ
jgi:hypothetical protein